LKKKFSAGSSSSVGVLPSFNFSTSPPFSSRSPSTMVNLASFAASVFEGEGRSLNLKAEVALSLGLWVNSRFDLSASEQGGGEEQGDCRKEFARAHMILHLRVLSPQITSLVLVGNRKSSVPANQGLWWT